MRWPSGLIPIDLKCRRYSVCGESTVLIARNMKSILLAVTLLAATPIFAADEVAWTYKVVEGEDATSTHYYFYHSDGGRIDRVRWVWNGGAQNAPKVTEFILGTGKFTIRHLVGKRESIPELIAGGEAPLEVKKEYSIVATHEDEMLLPPAPDKVLSEEQRVDLKNLIDLLACERKPFTTKPEPVGPSEGDKPSK